MFSLKSLKLIRSLEANTPVCPCCQGQTHFTLGTLHETLFCTVCGLQFKAPRSLTNIILAVYRGEMQSTPGLYRLACPPLT